jgi:phage tail-like protein
MPEAEYPYLNLAFKLDIEGQPEVAFAECAGLSHEFGTEDYHEGGENRFSLKLPTACQPPNLVLKRGITLTLALWNWHAAYAKTGLVEPKNGTVKLYTSVNEKEPVRAWRFTGGYPVKWTGPELNAGSPGIAFETIEIVHQGLTTVVPAAGG